MPTSILFNINGLKIYHAGDTSLSSEMKFIGEVYKPDIALLPVGSCYTMDIDDAIIATKWLGSPKVIPMHYNTFEAINTDTKLIESKFKHENLNIIIMEPGTVVEL